MVTRLLHGLLVPQMCGLNAYTPDELIDPGAEASIAKFHHCISQVTFGVKRGRSDIDVDHELLICGPNGGVKALPCFETTAEVEGFVWEKESVPTDHDAIARGVLGKDDVKRREKRCDVEIAVFWVTGEISCKNRQIHVLDIVHFQHVFLLGTSRRGAVVFLGVGHCEIGIFGQSTHRNELCAEIMRDTASEALVFGHLLE